LHILAIDVCQSQSYNESAVTFGPNLIKFEKSVRIQSSGLDKRGNTKKSRAVVSGWKARLDGNGSKPRPSK